MNTLLQQARQRAQSRATVINSLHETYKKEKKNGGGTSNGGGNQHSSGKNSSMPSSSSGKSQQNDLTRPENKQNNDVSKSNRDNVEQMTAAKQLKACVDILVDNVFEVKNDKNREFVRENFNGKAVILENTFSQKKAGSSAARIKRKLQGQGKLSKRQLKRRNLLNYYYHPSGEELLLLLHGWQDYILQLMQSSQSMQQLQARLMQGEMIGAPIIVLQCPNGHLEQVKGIVTNYSKDYFYIVHDQYEAPLAPTTTTTTSSTSSLSMLPLPEDGCVDGNKEDEDKDINGQIEGDEAKETEKNTVEGTTQPQQKQQQQQQSKGKKGKITKAYLTSHPVIALKKEEVVVGVLLPYVNKPLVDEKEEEEDDDNTGSVIKSRPGEDNSMNMETVDSGSREKKVTVSKKDDWWERVFNNSTGLLSHSKGKVMVISGKHYQPFLSSSF